MIYGDGIPEAPPDDRPVCPECGKKCETIFMDRKSDAVYGCDRCIIKVDAFDWFEDLKREEAERW